MGVDQPTEDVLKASSDVERARAHVAEARKAHMAAAERHRAAEEHLERMLLALQEAVRAKALADLKGTHEGASAEAFKLRYPNKVGLIEGAARDLARSAMAGQLAATATYLAGSHLVGAPVRAIESGLKPGVTVQVLFNARSRGVPISVQVRELFRNNPTLSFNATDVQRLLELTADKESAVRQNLRRLTEAEFITREERGLYRLNPVPHAPPPIEED